MDESLTLTGVVLVIIGAVCLFIPFVCFVGIPLLIVGLVILLVGAVSEGHPRVMYAYPPASAGPYAPPAAPPAGSGPPTCPRCGQPLQYVPQYQRWFCPMEQIYPWG